MVQPSQVVGKYQYVFVLLDDIKLLPCKQSSGGDSGSGRGKGSGGDSGRGGSSGSGGDSGGGGGGDSGGDSGGGSGGRRLLTTEQRAPRPQRGSKRRKFDLSLLLDIMHRNNLTAATPMVVGANKGGGQAFRTIMQRPAVVGTQGYVSVFVELFAWVGTGKSRRVGMETATHRVTDALTDRHCYTLTYPNTTHPCIHTKLLHAGQSPLSHPHTLTPSHPHTLTHNPFISPIFLSPIFI